MTETEQWRPIEGYEGICEVSNLGRIRRVKGYDSLGHLRNEKILRPRMNCCGYLLVGLCREGKQRHFSVHRLVAQAFLPNPDGLPQVNHKDEDKTNNRADNLEWCTRSYNINYGTRIERQVQTRISNGNADPEMCGIVDKKEYDHLRYQKNREKKLEQDRLWRQKNQEKVRERSRLYYQKNKEKIRESHLEYRRRKEKTKQTT